MCVSKRVREEAAQLCSACACHGVAISIAEAAAALFGIHETSVAHWLPARVAVRAWSAANRSLALAADRPYDALTLRDEYAEAEALLRTGWSPT